MKVHINSYWSGDSLTLKYAGLASEISRNESAGFFIETESQLPCKVGDGDGSILIDDDVKRDGALHVRLARIIGVVGLGCRNRTRWGSCSSLANKDDRIVGPAGALTRAWSERAVPVSDSIIITFSDSAILAASARRRTADSIWIAHLQQQISIGQIGEFRCNDCRNCHKFRGHIHNDWSG